MASPRIPTPFSTMRRRRHPPAPLLGNRSGTARVYTNLLPLATRKHQEAASRWLPTTPSSSSSAWRPGARNHALPRHAVGASLPFRTATGAVIARGAALTPSRCPPARAPSRCCATILAQARLGEFHRLHEPTFFERLFCCCRRCCCSARFGLFFHWPQGWMRFTASSPFHPRRLVLPMSLLNAAHRFPCLVCCFTGQQCLSLSRLATERGIGVPPSRRVALVGLNIGSK